MKMKFGAVVVDGRGKIGGHVASKNRACAYLRTKVTPVNPQTAYQLGVRNRFTNFSQQWAGLTQAQRDAWNAAVASFARTNIFGDLVNPSGFNLFQRLNNNRSLMGLAQLNTPPAPAAVGVVVQESVAAGIALGTIVVTLSANVPAATQVKVYATPPTPEGKSFVKNQFRLIGMLAAATATPVDITTDYEARFGDWDTVDQKIFVKMIAVNEATGQEGTPSEVYCQITA